MMVALFCCALMFMNNYLSDGMVQQEVTFLRREGDGPRGNAGRRVLFPAVDHGVLSTLHPDEGAVGVEAGVLRPGIVPLAPRVESSAAVEALDPVRQARREEARLRKGVDAHADVLGPARVRLAAALDRVEGGEGHLGGLGDAQRVCRFKDRWR